MKRKIFLSLLACTAATVPLVTLASSHREAPFIAGQPRVDGTDFYMFRSYEPGRENFVTFIANYNPLQDAYGDRKSTRLNSSHSGESRMPSSA